MTSGDAVSRSRNASRPRCASKFPSPPKSEGAGNTGCTLHPRSREQRAQKNTLTSIQVQRRQSGIPCAFVLRLIPCPPRRSGLGLSPSPARLGANLTPALRRQDHTISPYASALCVQQRL